MPGRAPAARRQPAEPDAEDYLQKNRKNKTRHDQTQNRNRCAEIIEDRIRFDRRENSQTDTDDHGKNKRQKSQFERIKSTADEKMLVTVRLGYVIE